MGFYVRKSISAGPFRFNLSKSGVGVSVGVPGFRVGTGPRGNYVHLGGNGIYYRTTLGAGRSAVGTASIPAQPGPRASDVVMTDATGATPMALAPTGGGDLVDQLNTGARQYGAAWPTTLVLLALGLLVLPFSLVLWVLAVPFCWWLCLRDKARRTTVVLYDVTDAPADWFDRLVGSWGWLSGADRLWRVTETGAVVTTAQFKGNSGASAVVGRTACTATLTGPEHLATNVAVPSIVAGASSLHFLPDRLLVRQGKHYTDVGYQHLTVQFHASQFVEGVYPVPSDTARTGHTWRYVNVKGGPDRRYRNNPVVPIVEYGYIDLLTSQGLNWRIQISRAEAAARVGSVLAAVPRM